MEGSSKSKSKRQESAVCAELVLRFCSDEFMVVLQATAVIDNTPKRAKRSLANKFPPRGLIKL